MSQRIEVLFERAAGTYRPGQVAVFLEGDPFLTAVLKGKFATVVNPPTWELNVVPTQEEVVNQSAVIKAVIKRDTQKRLEEKQIEDKTEEVEEASDNGDSNDDDNIKLVSGPGSLRGQWTDRSL